MNLMPARLMRLHLVSRRTPLALILIIATAVTLRAVQGLTEGTSEFAALLPLVLTVAAAAIIATSTASPFGEPERMTYPLPRLRLIHVVILLVVASVLLWLARIGHDPIAAIRDLAGFTGLALMTAAVITAPLAWITPLAYVIYCGGPLDIHQVTLWSWPALPGSNHTAALIALLLLACGLGTITATGARDHVAGPQ